MKSLCTTSFSSSTLDNRRGLDAKASALVQGWKKRKEIVLAVALSCLHLLDGGPGKPERAGEGGPPAREGQSAAKCRSTK